MIPNEVLAILLPLARQSEGCRLEAYQDSDGVWTIGDGHTGPEVQPSLVWSQAEADTHFAADLDTHYKQLLAVSPTVSTQTPGRQAALTDFVYNEGIGNYKHSLLRSAVDVQAWKNVQTQLARWIYGSGRVLPGLVARRNAEIVLIDA